MEDNFTHIDEFLSGLSTEELNYIADRAEVLLQEKENAGSGRDDSVEMSDFEEAMAE